MFFMFLPNLQVGGVRTALSNGNRKARQERSGMQLNKHVSGKLTCWTTKGDEVGTVKTLLVVSLRLWHKVEIKHRAPYGYSARRA